MANNINRKPPIKPSDSTRDIEPPPMVQKRWGCLDPLACNFNPRATHSNQNMCRYPVRPCSCDDEYPFLYECEDGSGLVCNLNQCDTIPGVDCTGGSEPDNNTKFSSPPNFGNGHGESYWQQSTMQSFLLFLGNENIVNISGLNVSADSQFFTLNPSNFINGVSQIVETDGEAPTLSIQLDDGGFNTPNPHYVNAGDMMELKLYDSMCDKYYGVQMIVPMSVVENNDINNPSWYNPMLCSTEELGVITEFPAFGVNDLGYGCGLEAIPMEELPVEENFINFNIGPTDSIFSMTATTQNENHLLQIVIENGEICHPTDMSCGDYFQMIEDQVTEQLLEIDPNFECYDEGYFGGCLNSYYENKLIHIGLDTGDESIDIHSGVYNIEKISNPPDSPFSIVRIDGWLGDDFSNSCSQNSCMVTFSTEVERLSSRETPTILPPLSSTGRMLLRGDYQTLKKRSKGS